MATGGELEQLAAAPHSPLHFIELRHRAIDVVPALNGEHRAGDLRQVVIADVPALESRIEPHVGPAIEGLAGVPVVAAEPSAELAPLESFGSLADRSQAERLDEDVRGHGDPAVDRGPAPR